MGDFVGFLFLVVLAWLAWWPNSFGREFADVIYEVNQGYEEAMAEKEASNEQENRD